MTAPTISVRVSVLQAITDFSERTGDPAAKDVLTLLRLAKKVEREIKTFKSKKLKAVKVMVDGSTAPLPEDAYNILKIYPGDLTNNINNYWRNLYSAGIYYETLYEVDYIWSSLDSTQYIDSKLFDIINEEIVFPTTFNDQEFTIFYNCWELDEMGYLIVNESHIEAISSYFKLFFISRKNYQSFKSSPMTRGNDLIYEKESKREYHVAKAQAKSDDLELTPMDQREIDEIY